MCKKETGCIFCVYVTNETSGIAAKPECKGETAVVLVYSSGQAVLCNLVFNLSGY